MSPQPDCLSRPIRTHAEALVAIGEIRLLLAGCGATLREPPPAPTTCCGRGCNGCVWEGYYHALAFWREDAAAALNRRLA